MPYATCPKNPAHAEFSTSAHVAQRWHVSRTGECTDVTHRPTSGNTWTCMVCGAEADVLDRAPEAATPSIRG
jgi:rubrerythrin